MILQNWFIILESFITIPYDVENYGQVVLLEKAIACTIKVYLFNKGEG